MTAKDIGEINEALRRFESIFKDVNRIPTYTSCIQYMRGYLGSKDVNLNIMLNMIEDFFKVRGWSLI